MSAGSFFFLIILFLYFFSFGCGGSSFLGTFFSLVAASGVTLLWRGLLFAVALGLVGPGSRAQAQ